MLHLRTSRLVPATVLPFMLHPRSANTFENGGRTEEIRATMPAGTGCCLYSTYPSKTQNQQTNQHGQGLSLTHFNRLDPANFTTRTYFTYKLPKDKSHKELPTARSSSYSTHPFKPDDQQKNQHGQRTTDTIFCPPLPAGSNQYYYPTHLTYA